MININKLFYEALSRIPKRFIDDKTVHIVWFWKEEKTVYITNPKYEPMMYAKGKWHYLKLGESLPQGDPQPIHVFKGRINETTLG